MDTGTKASRMEAFSFLNFYTHLTAPRGMINLLVGFAILLFLLAAQLAFICVAIAISGLINIYASFKQRSAPLDRSNRLISFVPKIDISHLRNS